jgi:hypothetical protein
MLRISRFRRGDTTEFVALVGHHPDSDWLPCGSGLQLVTVNIRSSDDLLGHASTAIRIGDRDRDSAARHLGVALAAGYLDLAENKNRIGTVFAAQSGADLDRVLGDLPVHAAAYLLMAVVVLTVWLAVALSVGAWYSWPIWPILGAGIGLVAHGLSIRCALSAADRG